MEDLSIKTATVIAVVIATFSSFPGRVQQDSAAQHQSSPAHLITPRTIPQSSSKLNASGGLTSGAATQLKPAGGERGNNRDTKSAMPRDNEILETDQSMTISTGTVTPKGSELTVE